MELDPVNMPGRDALYLQAGANTGASPTPGDIGPRPPDPTDPQYRMGIGLRILGIANNFLQGMAHRAPVVNTGSGATNGQFNQDLDAYHRDAQGKVTRTSVGGPTGVMTPANGGNQSVQTNPWEQDNRIKQVRRGKMDRVRSQE